MTSIGGRRREARREVLAARRRVRRLGRLELRAVAREHRSAAGLDSRGDPPHTEITMTHRVPARVGASLRLEGGALTDAEDALALGAALVGAAVDALGAALPGKLDASEWDAAAITALAEALEALRPPRL